MSNSSQATRLLSSADASRSVASLPSTLLKPRSKASISDATTSVSCRMAEIVADMESAARAVSSTAAVIIVTVCACASMAWRIRLADACTSFTVSRMRRSEEHTSELQSLMRNSYAVFCLKKQKKYHTRESPIKQITY